MKSIGYFKYAKGTLESARRLEMHYYFLDFQVKNQQLTTTPTLQL